MNTAIARAAALDWIKDQILQVSLPSGARIVHVYGHEPQAIYESRMAGIVYRGDGEADGYPRMTFGNQMVALRFDVIVYWAWGNTDPGALDDYERELIEFDRAIQAKLVADSDADGNVTALLTGSSQTGYMTRTADDAAFVGRWLQIPISLWELEAEAIAI